MVEESRRADLGHTEPFRDRDRCMSHPLSRTPLQLEGESYATASEGVSNHRTIMTPYHRKWIYASEMKITGVTPVPYIAGDL